MLDDFPAPVRANGDEVRLLGPGSWEGIAYGRHATADWASYQASVTMNGLSVYGVENAALVTRIGTGKEVSALVNSDFMRLSVGLGANAVVIGELPLPPNDQHTVAITGRPVPLRWSSTDRTGSRRRPTTAGQLRWYRADQL